MNKDKMTNCIYRFKNENQEVIYIGKTIDLNNRIRRHKHLDDKCYEEIKTVEYITLNTVNDIDLAERYLIAKYKPKYNTVYKYTYITLTINDLDNITWAELKDHKFINADTNDGLKIDIDQSEYIRTTVRVSKSSWEKFEAFCNEYKQFKKQDILSQFIEECVDKYN